MGQIASMIDDKLEEKFRKKIGEHMGSKRGNFRIALEEAIQNWVDRKP